MKTCSITDIGKNREMNQDFLFVSEKPVGNLPNLFMVADGMGGHNAGEYASAKTVEIIVDEIMQCPLDKNVEILDKAIKKANLSIIEAAENDIHMQGMGTTIVAVSIENDKVYVANVGDSRMYVVNEEITQITQDHSLVEEMVRNGELKKEEAKVHPDKNIITRAVGAAPEVSIDFFEVDIKPGDRIVLCSDGLTNMVSDEVIRDSLNGSSDIDLCTEQLVEAANQNGGTDNITVIVIEPF